MTRHISASPDTIFSVTDSLRAGDILALGPGVYDQPVVIEGAIGTPEEPIRIRKHPAQAEAMAVFTTGIDDETARKRANRIAQRRQASGYYPSVGQLGDQAMLVLRRCQYVIIEDLVFEDCWPTAIYIDECQNIAMKALTFVGGTLAIGANGMTTHDLLIENCSWQQDKSEQMWDAIAWNRIHGARNNTEGEGAAVSVEKDQRHLDGDFFRAWDIAGNVTIRNNTIRDAFNGIHFFNRVDQLDHGITGDSLLFNGHRRSTVNVLIENNTFIRIRDNVFEPENFAWNWVIRHNKLVDCFRPFSFELERAGYIYIYGNRGLFANKPSTSVSPEDEQTFGSNSLRRSMSVFKPKGTQANDGPICVLFNTWHMPGKSKGLFPKFALGELHHANNIIQLRAGKTVLFGNDGNKRTNNAVSAEKAEEQRFTRRWKHFDINMNGDRCNDPSFPDQYKTLGYALGDASQNLSVNFESTDVSEDAFLTPVSLSGLTDPIPLALPLPDDSQFLTPTTATIGAVQVSSDFFAELDAAFTFLPDTAWATGEEDQPASA